MLISMAGEGAVLIAENGEVYSSPAPKRNIGQWCRSRRFHGGRFHDRLDGKSRIMSMLSVWESQQEAQVFSEYLATRPEVEEVYKQLV